MQDMANLGNTRVRREVRAHGNGVVLGTTLGETSFRRGVKNEAPLRTSRVLGTGRREDVTHEKLHERARPRVLVELKEGCTRSEVVLLLWMLHESVADEEDLLPCYSVTRGVGMLAPETL